ARRVVVLELAGADPGQRMVDERVDPFLHHHPPRFARSVNCVLSRSSLTMLSIRVQNEDGMNGVATRMAHTAMAPKPGRTLRPRSTSDAIITRSPSAPPRDFVNTIVASISTQM